jgi:anion transporter
VKGLGLRGLVVLAGAGGAALCWSGAVAAEVAPAGRAALGVASLAVGLWGSEVLALPATGLLAIALLAITGAAPRVEDALVGFASPALYFLLGSAALGIAAERTGLADRLGAWLLARSRGSGWRLLGELLLSMPLQALLIPSAISRNAVLAPIYGRVLARLGRPPRLGAAVMLSLGVLNPLASSALLSGGIAPVATAQALGGFTWPTWFVALAPPYYVLLALGGALVWVVTRPERALVPAVAAEVGAPPGPLSAPEWRVAAIGLATAALWMLDWLTHWPPAVPALLALVALLAPRLGVMTWAGFAAQAPWGTGVVLAAAVSLAEALGRTGAADWLARVLFGGLPVGAGPAALALAIFGVTALMTLAIPNRAAAITLGVPLATAYAAAGGLSPTAAGLVVMVAVDVETIYPAQTAANLLAYEHGYVSAAQLARFNLLTLLAAAVVVVAVALPWWALVGLPAAR